MKRVAAKCMPHVLTADQKQSRVDACRELNTWKSTLTFFLGSLLVTKAGAKPMNEKSP
jgi:hypothetical protein